MDPITIILLASSTISLSTVLKEKEANIAVGKIGESFLTKIKSKKSEQLKIVEFKEVILEIIDETLEHSLKESSFITDKVVAEVLTELETYGNDIKTLGKRIDAKFPEILENMDRHLARQFLEMKYELNRFVYLAKDQSQKLLQFLQDFQYEKIDHKIDKSTEYRNFLSLCLAICNDYGDYPNSGEARSFIYHKLALDFFQLNAKDEIIINNHGITTNITGERLIEDFKFAQFFTTHMDPQITLQWKQLPDILDDTISVKTMIEVSPNFIILLESFRHENKRFQFLHEFMNIFYRLTEKKPGSMVGLSSLMDYEYRFNDLVGLQFEDTIIGFLYLLKMRNIELPTPFHHNLKSFEIRDDLKERLDTD